MSINDVFGEAKFGGNQTHWFKFPKEGGSLILRILPPYGSLKQSGRWSQYYVTHFGYRDTKGKLRPFESSEVINRQTKMIEVPDAAMDRIKGLRMAQEKAKIEGNTELVKKIGEHLRIFNAKKAHYMNVMDLEGKIGVLSIPHKMKMALDAKIKEFQQKGINPISAQGGRYFVFSRSGTGVNTIHQVDIYRDPNTDQQIVSNLTNEVAERMKSEGMDLSNMYIKPTPEEIDEIVKANGGAVLEAVFARHSKNAKQMEITEDYDDGDENGSLESSASSEESVVKPLSDTSSATVATSVSQEQVVANAPVEPVITTMNGKDVSQMSNEEFLKSLGV